MGNRGIFIKVHPATVILASFLLAIILGSAALKLPVSTGGRGISWIDSVFTATSAVCVTGLTVVDTGTHFSIFGQLVILGLIQVGGIGVMTISVALFQWLGHEISFTNRKIMQDLFAHTPRSDIFGLVRSIFLFTFAIEGVGALLLTLHWWREYPLDRALYMGVFHSISAFCNAGFALFPDSMIRYAGDVFFNAVLCCLIITGGIGFPVMYEINNWARLREMKRIRLSVHTRTVLATTVILIFAGALFIYTVEIPHARASSNGACNGACNGTAEAGGFLTPLFQSVTCRTAGFNTVDLASLSEGTLTLMVFLMFIGASPGSCGGGVKTTTLALLAAFTASRITDRRRVNLFSRSIPLETISRSLSLVVVSSILIGFVLFLLLVCDSVRVGATQVEGISFFEYLFETVSAFGTVGLSLGTTPRLGPAGKLLIILMMYVGRVGILTFSYIIIKGGPLTGKEYAEENMMIG